MKKRRGVTVLEIMVASVLLLLLTTLLFSAWTSASSSWIGMFRSTTRLSALEQSLRTLQNRLQDSATQATIYQNSPSTPALAFASAAGMTNLNAAGSYSYRPGSFTPLWQKYSVYYLASGALNYCEVAIPSGDAASLSQVPLDHWNGPSGVQPLTFYCTGGSVALAQVQSMLVDRSGAVLNVTLTTQPTGATSGAGNAPVTLTHTITLHN